MQNTTYVGVTRLRYVQCTHDKGRPYYYFRRRPFPIVRLPGKPGSKLFTTVYNSALAATSREQFTALRSNLLSNMKQYRPREARSPLETAVMAWAERKPITLSQATMVAKLFGATIEEILRGCEVVDQCTINKSTSLAKVEDNPTNKVLANLKDCEPTGEFKRL
jgi:hypothetical protein